MSGQELYDALLQLHAEPWRRDSKGRLLTTDGFLAEYLGEDPAHMATLLLHLQEQGLIHVDTWDISPEIRERHIEVVKP